MGWKKISNSVTTERPRKLTAAEKQEILSNYPRVKLQCEETANRIYEDFVKWLGSKLDMIEIVPSQFPKLKNKIYQAHHRSIIEHGTSVGARAAEALGAGTTQSTLSSFHQSGFLQQVGSVIDIMEQLIKASKSSKNRYCNVFFEEDMSFEEVLMMREEMVEVFLSQLISNHQVLAKNEIKDWWWSVVPKLKDYDGEVRANEKVLRIELNLEMLYRHRVTMENIVSAISDKIGDTLYPVYGSTLDGIIDFYPNVRSIRNALRSGKKKTGTGVRAKKKKEEEEEEETEEEEEEEEEVIEDKSEIKWNDYSLDSYFATAIGILSEVRVKGIPQVTNLVPNKFRIASVLHNAKKKGDQWTYAINRSKMRIYGVKEERLLRLFQLLGMRATITGDQLQAGPSDKDPTLLIFERISEAREAQKLDAEIIRVGELNFATTEGSNLKNILLHPKVDTTRTYSNNPHDIYEIFGIEATRSIYIRLIYDVMSETMKGIDPVHVILMSEMLTYRGMPMGATFVNIKGPGGIYEASIERAVSVIANSAAYGMQEGTDVASLSIAIGAIGKYGTGAAYVGQHTKGDDKYEEEVRDLYEDKKEIQEVKVFSDKDLEVIEAVDEGEVEPDREPGLDPDVYDRDTEETIDSDLQREVNDETEGGSGGKDVVASVSMRPDPKKRVEILSGEGEVEESGILEEFMKPGAIGLRRKVPAPPAKAVVPPPPGRPASRVPAPGVSVPAPPTEKLVPAPPSRPSLPRPSVAPARPASPVKESEKVPSPKTKRKPRFNLEEML